MFDAKMTRRTFATTMGVGALAALAGCGGGGAAEDGAESGTVIARMVTDTGGVHDQSFNEVSWKGMQRLRDENGWDCNYIESKQDADYATNLESAVDSGAQLVWGVGFNLEAATNEAADMNPDVQFAIVDGSNTNGAENVTGCLFKAEQPSFVVGYIAARMSKAGKVGFIGGQPSDTIKTFEYGYYAGIEYANAEQGTDVTVTGQYAESFVDAGKGKAIAQKMIKDGCDVIFHAAGNVGTGMIEACAEGGIYAIGVDMDQAHLAPETVITSALKKVDEVVVQVSNGLMDGSIEGGQNLEFGIAEGAVGIAETHDLLPDDLYNEALGLFDKIQSGDIVIPKTEDEFKAYSA